MLEFVDLHGNEVLNLGSFTLLPQHVVRLILARELKADEVTKFQVRSPASCITVGQNWCISLSFDRVKHPIGT